MIIKNLSFKEIHPYIRNAQFLDVNPSQNFIYDYKAYDHRLFYVYNSTGIIKLNKVIYHVSSGELFIWQPGVMYSLICNDNSHLYLLSLSFDFTQDNNHLDLPIGPKFSHIFLEEKIIESVRFNDIEAFNEPIHLKNMNILEEPLLDMVKEFTTKKRFYENKISGMFITMLSNIARFICDIYIDPNKKNHTADMILQYLHQNFNKDITNASLGEVFNFHPNYINKIIVKNTGKSLHQYLLSYRISQAIDLIINTNMCISEIAYAVGFKDANHFTKLFRTKTGKPPSYFRKNHK